MKWSREEIAAFADGELDPAQQAEIAAAVAADPELGEQVRAHRALRERLAQHFEPILEAPLPERLTKPLQHQRDGVISLGVAREKRAQRTTAGVSRWAWFAGPALAASLALAVFLPRGEQDNYAQGPLAAALEQQLVSSQEHGARQRILLSFRNDNGEYCRAFVGREKSGIACREAQGWRLEEEANGASAQQTEYRMAGSSAASLLDRAQAMAAGPALDAGQERGARERGWR